MRFPVASAAMSAVYCMNIIRLTIIKCFGFLSVALGLLLFCKPDNVHAVTTLTMGDGTVFFADSNNYYEALCQALDTAVSRGLCPSNFNYRYMLQQYPLLEYIDGDNPDLLLDIFCLDDGRICIVVSPRSDNSYTYNPSDYSFSFSSPIRFMASSSDGSFYTFAPSSRMSPIIFSGGQPTAICSFGYCDLSPSIKFPFLFTSYSLGGERGIDTFLDYITETGYSLNFLLNSSNDSFSSVGDSSVYIDYSNSYIANHHSFTPVVVSSQYLLLPDYISFATFSGSSHLYLNGIPPEDFAFDIWNEVSYSVIGSSTVPSQPITLITPSPVPTLPYNNATPTPLAIIDGIFGIGDTNVNVSSDYQNIFRAVASGLDSLEVVPLIRVTIDYLLTSSLLGWCLIPVMFIFVAWVWGLKPSYPRKTRQRDKSDEVGYSEHYETKYSDDDEMNNIIDKWGE